jgi:hypothetical protein
MDRGLLASRTANRGVLAMEHDYQHRGRAASATCLPARIEHRFGWAGRRERHSDFQALLAGADVKSQWRQ